MRSRQESRISFAKYLNAIDAEELFGRFGITRVGDLTGLDTIGVPVWSACRPASKTVSVSAGKSQDSNYARAGSIAESIEFHTFENPTKEEWVYAPYQCAGGYWPLAKDSKWTPNLSIAQEGVTRLWDGNDLYLPSDLIWLDQRAPHSEPHFQMSSNGQAVGYCFNDALLSGLYEVAERDAITCRICSWQEFGVKPPRVDISSPPQRLSPMLEACDSAGATVFLFYATIDIEIPVYWAYLIDDVGAFCGWGCDIDHIIAAERAILEAIQSRAVYIAGARDDIMRRTFDLVRNSDPRELKSELESMSFIYRLPEEPVETISLEEELALVTDLLGDHFLDVYYKHIDLGDIHAVKTVVLGLEGIRSHDMWKPTRWLKIKETCGIAQSTT